MIASERVFSAEEIQRSEAPTQVGDSPFPAPNKSLATFGIKTLDNDSPIFSARVEQFGIISIHSAGSKERIDLQIIDQASYNQHLNGERSDRLLVPFALVDRENPLVLFKALREAELIVIDPKNPRVDRLKLDPDLPPTISIKVEQGICTVTRLSTATGSVAICDKAEALKQTGLAVAAITQLEEVITMFHAYRDGRSGDDGAILDRHAANKKLLQKLALC